ncbi:MAG TPA: hypothetical protein VM344_07460 [Vitreimonas sp.]|nr:hypothetical protein [Vitreimonas sp.]
MRRTLGLADDGTTNPGKGEAMPAHDEVWEINEAHRREAVAVARERLARASRVRARSSAGRLVGWLRDRWRVARDGLGASAGWKASG